jgi:hypothetical protein
MKTQLINTNITDLLINRNWRLHEAKGKYNIFVPPSLLGFSDTYKLYVYNKFENSDFEKEIIRNLDIISQIYKEDIDELASIIIEDKQILTLHIENESVLNGHPSIPFFNTLLNKSKELLQEVANFSVIKQPHFFDNRDEAERYLKYCNFFKNDVGSLITKIQLPNNEEIKEQTLFEKSVIGSEINRNLIDIADFINTEIIGNDNFEPTDEFLIQNRDLVSVNVSNKLKDLYTGIDFADIEISLKGTQVNEKTTARELTKENVGNLATFSKTIRAKMKEISENDVYGKIIQLNSKNVDGEKNTILVEGEIKKVRSRIVVKLNSDQIKLAADAFKGNRTILLNAILEKEKGQYKVTELKDFRALSK